MTSKQVEQAIRALGLAVTRVDGKWRINYRGGKEATAYYTTDDDDAAMTDLKQRLAAALASSKGKAMIEEGQQFSIEKLQAVTLLPSTLL